MGYKKETQLLVFSAQLICLGALSLRLKLPGHVKGLISSLCFVGSIVSLDMRHLRPADSSSWGAICGKYLEIITIRTLGRLAHWRAKLRSRNVMKVQEDVLKKYLEHNKNTLYGLEWKLADIHGRGEFRRKHPLTNYSHYEKWVERVANGEKNVMTSDEPVFIAMTSGTTGRNKMFPLTKSHARRLMTTFLSYSPCYLPLIRSLKRGWEFRLASTPRKAPGGLGQGSFSQYFIDRHRPGNVVPACAYKLTKEEPCFYTQALFVLSEPELFNIDAFSSNLLYSFFKYVEEKIDYLCADIARGAVSTKVEIEEQLREKLGKQLTANPLRAAHVLAHMKSDGAVGFAKRIWPDLEYVTLAKSGGFAQAYKLIAKTYLKGVKIVSPAHGGTECFPSINQDVDKPEQDVYTMMPESGFMEFIPLEEVDQADPATVFMDQMEVGRSYEMVITNIQGLYRYRIGDIIKIVGHNGAVPKYEFQYRLGQRLNIAFERTPEKEIYEAVSSSVSDLRPDVTLEDFTSTESIALESVTGCRSAQNRYVIFVEASPSTVRLAQDEEFVKIIDERLCELHLPYGDFRRKGSISPLKVLQVQSGTFEKLKHELWGEYQNMQFKMPRVERREPLLKTLLEHVIETA